MRLRTFESFWLVKNGIIRSYPSLQEDTEAEIVVVGAGITGALVSHALVDQGFDVLVIDKRDVAMGSSSATTSMLQYELDVPLYELAEIIGEDAAAACYQAGIKAIDKLDELVKTLKLDCGFQRKKSLYAAHNRKAAMELHHEFGMRNKHNLGVKWMDEAEIQKRYGMVSHGGILSEAGGTADIYKMAHELFHYNTQRGLRLYDQVQIDDFVLNEEQPSIKLQNGHMIRCKKVVLCTGFESTEMLKEKVAELFYTYACVSEQKIELPGNIDNLLIWDTDDPYLYIRTTDDNRLLVGGEDSSNNLGLFQQRKKERKADALIEKLEKKFPGVKFIEDFSWGGTFGSTKDGLPYIGQSPEFKHALFVLGFGGNGITFSAQAMDIIPALLKDEKPPLAQYYRFGRS